VVDLPDNTGEWLFVVLTVAAILIVGSLHVPWFDEQIRFSIRDAKALAFGHGGPLDQFGPDVGSDQILFAPEHQDKLNTVSKDSLGMRPTADERLYCLEIRNNIVTEVALVHDIEESERHSVSGKCQSTGWTDYSGTVHTHPYYNEEPSRQDRTVAPWIEVTCIQYDVIQRTPTGEVGGIHCWQPTDAASGELAQLEPVEVRLQ